MRETRIEIRKKCEDGIVNIVDNDNNPIGSQTVESGEVETFVVTDLPCGDATVTNGTTYTDTVASGGTLLLPTENITVNGNLLVNKPSVQDYNVEVVDGDD